MELDLVLIKQLKRLYYLKSIQRQLKWDTMVNLPEGSHEQRASEVALLEVIIREAFIDKGFIESLEKLENKVEPSVEEKVIARGVRKDVDRALKLSFEFLEEKSRHQNRSYQAWVEARKSQDFSIFAPYLEKSIDLSKKEAEILAPNKSQLDYWVDNFSPGMDVASVGKLFDDLERDLKPVIEAYEIQYADVRIPEIPKLNPEKLLNFTKEVTKQIGFDYRKGRLDYSVHPFCGGGPEDIRITTKDKSRDCFNEILFSSLHEAGHGLYEQGLVKETLGTPLSEASGLAIHESQSRIWENQIGRSEVFWRYWYSRLKDVFKEELKHISFEELLIYVKHGSASTPIRVDSHEFYYNLHIIHRFRLEKGLFDGSISVKELPEVWNAIFEELLKISPKNILEGALQDIHWAMVGFGYYPSYCLGNILAAQFWEGICANNDNLEVEMSAGDFSSILKWLRGNIHEQGKRYNTLEITEAVLGKSISHVPLINYFKKRFN